MYWILSFTVDLVCKRFLITNMKFLWNWWTVAIKRMNCPIYSQENMVLRSYILFSLLLSSCFLEYRVRKYLKDDYTKTRNHNVLQFFITGSITAQAFGLLVIMVSLLAFPSLLEKKIVQCCPYHTVLGKRKNCMSTFKLKLGIARTFVSVVVQANLASQYIIR